MGLAEHLVDAVGVSLDFSPTDWELFDLAVALFGGFGL
jgi:hypothetical protein